MPESYLGIDVHKKQCVFTEIDSKGKILRRGRFGNTFGEVADFCSTLSRRANVVLEPVLNYLWLLDHLEPYVKSVHVATPYKVRVIAESKSKTDKYDSRVLAELLRTNFLPEGWVPPLLIRRLRVMVRQRRHLVKSVVMNKNRIRHLLFEHGFEVSVSDISSRKAKRIISQLPLPATTRGAVDGCLYMIGHFEKLIEKAEDDIRRSVEGNKTVALLETIPGIAQTRSAIIYAEIGDISRFHSPKALANYTGLIPQVRSSGDSVWRGGITNVGSKPLRYALVEAAIDAVRASQPLSRLYYRILFRSNRQKARVAVARKLAIIVYHMLSRGEAFRAEEG